MATTRDQYVGLNMDVLSTRMKRRGVLEIEGRLRDICRKFEVVVSVALGGMKVPSSRKDFMFDIRRREEAEGESRIIGCSVRREGFLRFETRGEGCACAGFGSEGRERRNIAAVLR